MVESKSPEQGKPEEKSGTVTELESVKSGGNKKPETTRKNGSNRPSVIPLIYPDKESLQQAYMPFLKGGGLFFPTKDVYPMSEEIFLLVTLPDTKNTLPVPGTVIWQTPGGAMDNRKQGVGIEFKGREGNALRNRIEGMLGAKLSSPNPTYTM